MESIHQALARVLEEEFSDALTASPEAFCDGVRATLEGGVALEVRYPSAGEYSFAWATGGKTTRIDTAPVHGGLDTSPNHVHTPGGDVASDRVTDPAASPENNLRGVVDFILKGRGAT